MAFLYESPRFSKKLILYFALAPGKPDSTSIHVKKRTTQTSGRKIRVKSSTRVRGSSRAITGVLINPDASERSRNCKSCSKESNSDGRSARKRSSQSSRAAFDGDVSKYSSNTNSVRHSCAACEIVGEGSDGDAIDGTSSCERSNAMASAIRTGGLHGLRRRASCRRGSAATRAKGDECDMGDISDKSRDRHLGHVCHLCHFGRSGRGKPLLQSIHEASRQPLTLSASCKETPAPSPNRARRCVLSLPNTPRSPRR